MTFRQLAEAYRQQIAGLVAGGVDVLLIETIFDTLNAKAAIWAAATTSPRQGPRSADGLGHDHRPLRVARCRARRPSAFWQSVRHADPLSVGPQLRARRGEMRQYVEELAGVADTLVCAYPNAGLPNALGCYDETPQQTAAILGEFADAGFVNIVGGCCGTTPAHIAAIADAVAGIAAAHACRASPHACSCRASSRSRSPTTSRSSTSASGPTSPARPSSAA